MSCETQNVILGRGDAASGEPGQGNWWQEDAGHRYTVITERLAGR